MGFPEDIKFLIALSQIPGVGSINAKKLISYFGSAEAVFRAKEQILTKVPGIGSVIAGHIMNPDSLGRAEKEIQFITKNRIRVLSYTDNDYPSRLKYCIDAPLVLFSLGDINFNAEKTVAVVGTRKATQYGKDFCNDLVAQMAEHGGYCVVSGLAYGIDIAAHKACMQHGVHTIGVLGHGLDNIYPALHKNIAVKMLKNGGLASDFISNTKIERQNFLRRNRIIAGLADAVIIVESAETGGALITADIADSYNRDVFAVPGRASDIYSRGCNELIRHNKASLIKNLDDVEYFMSWQKDIDLPPVRQKQIFAELSGDEQKIVDVLHDKTLGIDELCLEADMPVGKVSSILLGLEFNGVIVSLPGKMYRIR